jgi:hypothetical protein
MNFWGVKPNSSDERHPDAIKLAPVRWIGFNRWIGVAASAHARRNRIDASGRYCTRPRPHATSQKSLCRTTELA